MLVIHFHLFRPSRTLLRHNCLVLGIDEKPIPTEERLFSAAFTHFQRLEMKLDAENALQQIIDQTEHLFWKKGFHMLVTFDEGESAVKLRQVIGQKIAESDGGVVLNVSAHTEPVRPAIDAKGVRSNAIASKTFSSGDDMEGLALPNDSIPEVQDCFRRFRDASKDNVDSATGNKSISELVLFLCSSLGDAVDGKIITADGFWNRS